MEVPIGGAIPGPAQDAAAEANADAIVIRKRAVLRAGHLESTTEREAMPALVPAEGAAQNGDGKVERRAAGIGVDANQEGSAGRVAVVAILIDSARGVGNHGAAIGKDLAVDKGVGLVLADRPIPSGYPRMAGVEFRVCFRIAAELGSGVGG